MAVTISRTPWIDDDGTGQTGTVLNNAMKMGLYNEIDAALAQCVAVDASGYLTRDLLWNPDATYDIGKSAANRPRDVFASRNLIAGGVLAVNGFGTHSFIASGTGQNVLEVANTTSGVGNNAHLQATCGTTAANLYAFPQGYSSGTWDVASSLALNTGGLGGISIAATAPAGAIRFYSGGTTERMRVDAGGMVLIGTASTAGMPGATSGGFAVVADPTANVPLTVRVSSNVVNGGLVYFLNPASTVQGAILAASSTSVSYNTTSDQRLKIDHGVAHDLTALRAVVVHDFAWTHGAIDRGIFAQETQPVFARAVTVGDDTRTETGELAKPWMTDYSKFVPDLVVGWQDHDRRLAKLETLLMERTAA